MTPGQSAYEGYFAYSSGKSLVSGTALPALDSLPVTIQEAWIAAANSVLAENGQQCPRCPVKEDQ